MHAVYFLATEIQMTDRKESILAKAASFALFCRESKKIAAFVSLVTRASFVAPPMQLMVLPFTLIGIVLNKPQNLTSEQQTRYKEVETPVHT